MPVTADRVGQARDPDRETVIVRIEPLYELVDDPLVLLDQRPLAPARRREAEGIESRAAKPLQPHEQSEHLQDPGAELSLARRSRQRIPAPDSGHGEVEAQLGVALELRLHPGLELGQQMQPCNLVRVLVGQQLEEVAGHRLGQPVHPPGTGKLRLADPVHEATVARRVVRALVGGQELDAPFDELVEARWGVAGQ